MKEVKIEKRDEMLINQLLIVWKNSVKETHLFLSKDETPGLGMNAQKDSYKDQYKQPVPENGFTLVKGEAAEGEISAMTGATITSTAVTDAVNAAIEQYNTIKEGA